MTSLGDLRKAYADRRYDDAWAIYRALELCEQIVGRYDAVPHDVRSHACWLAGRVALEIGQLEAAEGFANQAVHYGSLARDENRCLMDAAELLRQVRQIRLQPQPPGSD